MPCALSSALVIGGCRGLGLNGAMVPLVLCGQYVCSPEQPLYSLRWCRPNRQEGRHPRCRPRARAHAAAAPLPCQKLSHRETVWPRRKHRPNDAMIRAIEDEEGGQGSV